MSFEVDTDQLAFRAGEYYSAGIYMTGVRPGRFVDNVMTALPNSTTASQASASAAAVTNFVTAMHDLLQGFGDSLMQTARNYEGADNGAVQALNIQ